MELEEMRHAWTEMSAQLARQKKLTDKIILEMTQQKYRGKFSKFLLYEGLGAVICFGSAFYILWNFDRLDTWYFLGMGVLALLFLLGLPLYILGALRRIQRINITGGSFRENLYRFAKAKKWLLQAQRVGIYLSFLFIFISIPLAGKLLKGQDFFTQSLGWLWFVPVLGLFVFFFSRWGYDKYLAATKSAEALIRDLE